MRSFGLLSALSGVSLAAMAALFARTTRSVCDRYVADPQSTGLTESRPQWNRRARSQGPDAASLGDCEAGAE